MKQLSWHNLRTPIFTVIIDKIVMAVLFRSFGIREVPIPGKFSMSELIWDFVVFIVIWIIVDHVFATYDERVGGSGKNTGGSK